ncbi:MAG TPA: hypothetical protein VIN08_24320 [Ohtaekwangia sp.]|uniref:hypothetical protein n=1 Tax=Ohtaekwangia sp. TaxID=2066019 RepID=UPI002F957A1C
MKRNILYLSLALVLFILPGIVRAQIAYQDAWDLAALNPVIDNGQVLFPIGAHKKAAEILKKYTNKTTYAEIQSEFTANPFIELAVDNSQSSSTITAGAAKLFAGAANLDITTQAEGIALFMISRAKEELTISFFNRFKKCVEENPEIAVLFPKTAGTLEHLLSYHYPEMLPALQNAFYDDLNALPNHIDDVLELPRYRELLLNFPEVRIAIHSIRIVQQLESGDAHLYEIIDQFAKLEEWDDAHASIHLKNAGNSVRLGNIISQSLLSNTRWVSVSDILSLVQDKIAFEIYLGLIYQQVKNENITFLNAAGNATSFTDVMKNNQETLIIFQMQLTEFIQLADKVENTAADIRDKRTRNEKLTNEDYYTYISAGIDVIEYSFGLVKLFNEQFAADDYIKMMRNGNDLYKNIVKKEYSAAITNAVNIFKIISDVVGKDKEAAIKTDLAKLDPATISDAEIKAIVTDAKGASQLDDKKLKMLASKKSELRKLNVNGIISRAIALINIDSLQKIIPEISKYGLFIANVANAKTPEEVQQVIEAAVLPVGSSSIKKNSQFNVSVQSYLGAYWSSNAGGAIDRAWNSKFGVIAPIGISASYGFKKWGSASVFATLLDLGAIVDYHLKYDSVSTGGTKTVATSKNYQIKLGQIFSPGGYIVYGLPFNLPLSIGFGGQYGPGLSKIEADGRTVVDNPYWRWSAFLAVDIPLFNIFNREGKKK